MRLAAQTLEHRTNDDQRAPDARDVLTTPDHSGSALKMAGAVALPALIKPARAADASVLRAAFAIQPATLDPQKMRVGGVDYNYVYNCFSRLTAQDPKLQVQPDLATSWEAAEDLKTWTFHLRPGVKFHNGKPLEADDVVFTFKRILDKEVGSVLRVNFSLVDSIEAVDPLTVRFNLSLPYADLPAAVAAYQAAIVSESVVDTLTTHPIGTGPFRFVEYRPGDQLVMERNPDYFLPGVPTLDRVIIRIIPEFTTSVAALESGAVDAVFDLPPEQIEKLAKTSVAHVDEVQAGRWQGIIWNCEMKPFDDPRVRRAFNRLIDKQAIVDIAMFGHATPTLRRSRRFTRISAKTSRLAAPTSPAPRNCWQRQESPLAGNWKCTCRATTRRASGSPQPSVTLPSRPGSTSSCASLGPTSSSRKWKEGCGFRPTASTAGPRPI
jgi:ABC-type transport system substrate-binding protein